MSEKIHHIHNMRKSQNSNFNLIILEKQNPKNLPYFFFSGPNPFP